MNRQELLQASILQRMLRDAAQLQLDTYVRLLAIDLDVDGCNLTGEKWEQKEEEVDTPEGKSTALVAHRVPHPECKTLMEMLRGSNLEDVARAELLRVSGASRRVNSLYGR